MTATVLPNGKNYFADSTGAPLVGGKVYTYVPGTSTPKDTYTTSAGTVANTNPVVLDSRGEAAIYWNGTYDVVLKTSADVTVWGPERVESPLFTIDFFVRTSGEISAGVTPTNYGYPPGDVRRYGAVGDGVTDNAAVLQTLFDAWVDTSGFDEIIFPPMSFKIASGITVTPAANVTRRKVVRGHGARIVSTSATHAIKFTVEASAALWRNLVVAGLTIDGGVNGLIFEGGDPASSEWMYNCVLRDLHAENFTGNGIECRQGFFESQLYSCSAWAPASNTTGYPIYFNNGSHGIISSIDMFACNTRNGLIGVYAASPSSNINVYGGTFLSAQNEGIYFPVAIGSSFVSPHVEDNWQAGGGTIRAGLRVSGRGNSLVSVWGTSRDSTKQNYTARIFASAGTTTVTGGVAEGLITKFGYYDTSGDTGAVASLGAPSYDFLAGSRIYSLDVNGARLPSVSLAENFIAYAASITPDLDKGAWINVGELTGNITINNPTLTSAVLVKGSQLEVLLRQDGTGGRTVTWDTQFKVTTAIGAAASQRTQWQFRWDGTNFREIAAAITAA